MKAFMSRTKINNQNRKTLISWGIYAAAFLIVVVILVAKFLAVNKTNAVRGIKADVLSDAEINVTKFGGALDRVKSYGRGAAAVIENAGSMTEAEKKAYSKYLADAIPDLYMVIITDIFGAGVTSGGREVNLTNSAYYLPGTTARVAYTENDEITGTTAYVFTVPYLIKNSVSGYICLFIDADGITEVLPTTGYGGGMGFALIDSEGNIITRMINESAFSAGNSLFANLEAAELEDLTLDQIKIRVEKQNKMVFNAKGDGEHRVVSIAPVGIEDWQLVTFINKRYVDTMTGNLINAEKKLLIGLTLTIFLFVAMLVVMVLISKFRYGEESRDLADKADTDLLTGLSNKIATERKIQEYMDENPNTQCMMFLLDIDNFKKINDTMGHAFGDEVLRSLGHQLRNEFRVTDIIGRLGGDEFVLFLKNIKSEEQLGKEGARLVQFFRQFKAGGYVKYSATASIGAVVFPRDAKSFEEAYRAADKALYEAKRRGKNQLVIYGSNLEEAESIKAFETM